MNCDDCKKHLEEYDTYERILCRHCTAEATGTICLLCKCKVEKNNFFSRFRKQMEYLFGPVVEKRILLGSLYTLLIAGVAVFKPIMALFMLVGILFIPVVLFLLLFWFLVLTLGVCKIGALVSYLVGFDIDDDEPLKQWIVGASTILSPFIIYGLGILVVHLFRM